MTSLVSLVAMTLLAGCMAAPLLADRVFSRDLLEPPPPMMLVATPSGGGATR